MSQCQSWPVRPWWTGTARTSSRPSRWARRKSVWLERPTANWPDGVGRGRRADAAGGLDRRRVDAAVHHAPRGVVLGPASMWPVTSSGPCSSITRPGALDERARRVERGIGEGAHRAEAIVESNGSRPVAVSGSSRPPTSSSAGTAPRRWGSTRSSPSRGREDDALPQLRVEGRAHPRVPRAARGALDARVAAAPRRRPAPTRPRGGCSRSSTSSASGSRARTSRAARSST